LSFLPEYGPKLKEEYVMVKHLPRIVKDDDSRKCCACSWFSCCNDNWQKVMQSCPKLGLPLAEGNLSFLCVHNCAKNEGFCVGFFIITFSFIDSVE
jgi:hypothetical protein